MSNKNRNKTGVLCPNINVSCVSLKVDFRHHLSRNQPCHTGWELRVCQYGFLESYLETMSVLLR